jgi:hypothetical protein
MCAQGRGESIGVDLVADEVIADKNPPVNGDCAMVSAGMTWRPLVSD